MSTLTLRVPLLRTLGVDDDLFTALGGTLLHCSSLDEDGTVDFTAEGTEEAIVYCRRSVRDAA